MALVLITCFSDLVSYKYQISSLIFFFLLEKSTDRDLVNSILDVEDLVQFGTKQRFVVHVFIFLYLSVSVSVLHFLILVQNGEHYYAEKAKLIYQRDGKQK